MGPKKNGGQEIAGDVGEMNKLHEPRGKEAKEKKKPLRKGG
jgi:hypothetical protein